MSGLSIPASSYQLAQANSAVLGAGAVTGAGRSLQQLVNVVNAALGVKSLTIVAGGLVAVGATGAVWNIAELQRFLDGLQQGAYSTADLEAFTRRIDSSGGGFGGTIMRMDHPELNALLRPQSQPPVPSVAQLAAQLGLPTLAAPVLSPASASTRQPAAPGTPSKATEQAGLSTAQQQRLYGDAVQAAQARLQPAVQAYQTRLGELQQRASALIQAGVEPPGLRTSYAAAVKSLDAVVDRSQRMAVLDGAQVLFTALPTLRRIVDPSTGETFNPSSLSKRVATVGQQLVSAAERFVSQVAGLERSLDPKVLTSPGSVLPLGGGTSSTTTAALSLSPSAPDTPARLAQQAARQAMTDAASRVQQSIGTAAVPATPAGQQALAVLMLQEAAQGYPQPTVAGRIAQLLGNLGVSPDRVEALLPYLPTRAGTTDDVLAVNRFAQQGQEPEKPKPTGNQGPSNQPEGDPKDPKKSDLPWWRQLDPKNPADAGLLATFQWILGLAGVTYMGATGLQKTLIEMGTPGLEDIPGLGVRTIGRETVERGLTRGKGDLLPDPVGGPSRKSGNAIEDALLGLEGQVLEAAGQVVYRGARRNIGELSQELGQQIRSQSIQRLSDELRQQAPGAAKAVIARSRKEIEGEIQQALGEIPPGPLRMRMAQQMRAQLNSQIEDVVAVSQRIAPRTLPSDSFVQTLDGNLDAATGRDIVVKYNPESGKLDIKPARSMWPWLGGGTKDMSAEDLQRVQEELRRYPTGPTYRFRVADLNDRTLYETPLRTTTPEAVRNMARRPLADSANIDGGSSAGAGGAATPPNAGGDVPPGGRPPRLTAAGGADEPPRPGGDFVDEVARKAPGLTVGQVESILASNKTKLSADEYRQLVVKLVQYGSVHSWRDLARKMAPQATGLINPNTPSLASTFAYATRRNMVPGVPITMHDLYMSRAGSMRASESRLIVDDLLVRRMESDPELRTRLLALKPVLVYPRGADRGMSAAEVKAAGEFKNDVRKIAAELESLRAEGMGFESALATVFDKPMKERLARLGFDVSPDKFQAFDNDLARGSSAADISKLTTSQSWTDGDMRALLDDLPPEYHDAAVFVLQNQTTLLSRAEIQERLQHSYLEVMDQMKKAGATDKQLYIVQNLDTRSDTVMAAQFAQVNKIPSTRIVEFTDIRSLPANPWLLLVDDLAASGGTLRNQARRILDFRPDSNVRTTTLLTTPFGESNIEKFRVSSPEAQKRYMHVIPPDGRLHNLLETEKFKQLPPDLADKVLTLLEGGYKLPAGPDQPPQLGVGIFLPITGSPDNNSRFLRDPSLIRNLSNGNTK